MNIELGKKKKKLCVYYICICIDLIEICLGPYSHYDATRAYALSKLANVLHTKELAWRLKVV